jgi:hypothetical protein
MWTGHGPDKVIFIKPKSIDEVADDCFFVAHNCHDDDDMLEEDN